MTEPPPDDSEESVIVLCQNDWVRILTVQDSETPSSRRIEVEVSLPSQIESESGKDAKNFLQNLIRHLEYLLQLDDEGLTLGVMSRDGLWTASLEVEELPSDSLFKALIPPSL
ncbi:MAG: hypothetical protein PVJ05_02445 [Candidatus Thorarchaeota archaeon]|jgi:hypothetical protein